eukprot:TRINITY_DN9454_c0_g1_i1.p1 TRINITY_DN9454_c0_g1~~TRINITY_DN9454_c0_g1_i1.p1  ORF type:complete len:362 (-),score=112.57 TRINITY_DN9454_c0_g1_i1:124-1095(-)
MANSILMARVNFLDGSSKAFRIEPTQTVQQLRDQVVKKIELQEDSRFALFEKKNEWERSLEPEEKAHELIESWAGNSSCYFLFKKKIFLRDEEKEMKDPISKDLIYKQANFDIISSDYVCTVEQAIQLAGLQMQIAYGDCVAQTHTNGFLTTNDSLKNFVPKTLFPQRKAHEWESVILKQHSLNKGMSQDDAKKEYLDIVRSLRFYGTTFFPPCKTANIRALPNKVVIGVNCEGIHLFRSKNREFVSSHLFTEICSWSSSSTWFAFEFGNQNDSLKYQFETKQGAIIASTIQTYIDILVQMLKNGEDEDDDDSESITSQSSER